MLVYEESAQNYNSKLVGGLTMLVFAERVTSGT